MKFKLITILAFIWLTPVMAYTQSIIYVKPGGTGDGSTWEKATSDLHAVMQQPYTTIWVASGVYYGDTVTYNPNAFVVAEGVKIYGSFVGNEPENYDLSLRDFGQHPTVLDGKGKKRVLYSKDFDDVLACKGSTDSIIVDGFVFQNGMSGTVLTFLIEIMMIFHSRRRCEDLIVPINALEKACKSKVTERRFWALS